tara:strand:- start:279 stop:443 length:165 start_codon:yes stop_codon:yes gene_type:complete
MTKLDRDVLRFIVVIALAMLLAGCDPVLLCDEIRYGTNDDGSTYEECIYYYNNN